MIGWLKSLMKKGRTINWKLKDLKTHLQKTSSDSNMLKDQTIHGMPWPIALSKISVEIEGEVAINFLVIAIERSLHSILKSKSLYPEVDICITQVVPQDSIITVTCSEQKKIPEKNGAT